jgi:hypothetical protein
MNYSAWSDSLQLLAWFAWNGHSTTVDRIAQSPMGKGCEARFTEMRLVKA